MKVYFLSVIICVLLGCRQPRCIDKTISAIPAPPVPVAESTEARKSLMIGNPYSSRHLRPAHQAAALSFVDAQIIGIVSEKDKTELALLAARIPTLSWAKKIDSIQVLWPERALVAKLSINTARIYCAKNWEGVWEIIEVNEYVP